MDKPKCIFIAISETAGVDKINVFIPFLIDNPLIVQLNLKMRRQKH